MNPGCFFRRSRTADGLACHVILPGCLLANRNGLTIGPGQSEFVHTSMHASVFRHIFIAQNKMIA